MSWTVACFCGTVFETPPDRCPTCDSHVPDVRSTGRIDNAPRCPSVMSLRKTSVTPTDCGSLEREFSELIASTPPRLIDVETDLSTPVHHGRADRSRADDARRHLG